MRRSLLGNIGTWSVRTRDPGVVHEDVQPAKGGSHSGHRVENLVLFRNVGHPESGMTALRWDLLRDARGVLFVDVRDGDGRSFFGQQLAGCLADAVAPSRHHSHLASCTEN
jgi:hypothetical protein